MLLPHSSRCAVTAAVGSSAMPAHFPQSTRCYTQNIFHNSVVSNKVLQSDYLSPRSRIRFCTSLCYCCCYYYCITTTIINIATNNINNTTTVAATTSASPPLLSTSSLILLTTLLLLLLLLLHHHHCYQHRH